MIKRQTILILAAATLASVSIALSATTRPSPENLAAGGVESMTPAEAAFLGAPDGVDPMVTGPVSESFRSQQEQAGCDKAEWPHIPLACYPG